MQFRAIPKITRTANNNSIHLFDQQKLLSLSISRLLLLLRCTVFMPLCLMFLWSNPKLTHANWFCRLTVDGCDCSPNDGKLFAPLPPLGTHTSMQIYLWQMAATNRVRFEPAIKLLARPFVLPKCLNLNTFKSLATVINQFCFPHGRLSVFINCSLTAKREKPLFNLQLNRKQVPAIILIGNFLGDLQAFIYFNLSLRFP